MINDTLYKRRYIIAAIMTVVVVVYIIRLFSLQILNDKYAERADSNALLRKTQYPPRGLIYDRNGELLVFNQPAYDITLILREMSDKFDTIGFCNALNIDIDFFNKRMAYIKDRRKNRGYSRYTPQIFMTQLRPEEIATLQETLYMYPGVSIQNRTLRDYTYPNAAHVLGSIGEVSQKMLDEDPYYQRGDYAGRDGIEYTYEKALRGEKGTEIMLRDVRGRIIGKYENGAQDIEPHAGTDLTLTLDIQLQIVAEQLLNGKIGSVVAIQPATGEILALASNPTWNPALLVGRPRSKNYADLVHDKTKPLMNRATQAQYSPGSTFKTIQALVCLQEGGITENSVFPCNGPSSSPIKCTHHHGSSITLLNAIEQSCNPYFWGAFRETLEKNGYGEKNALFKAQYEQWRKDVMSFGLGQRFSDTDLYEQSRGYIPTKEFYTKYYGETGWRALTIRSLSIGQGEILVTPLQLANAISAIANEGYYITPHLNKCDSLLKHKHFTNVEPQHFAIIKEGMFHVFEYGTGRYYKLQDVSMCGKTGTVQNSQGKDHSLFVGFAPKEDPQIVLAVVVENAGFGATWAAPIASLLIEQYLMGKIERKDLFNRISTTVINPDVKKR